MQKYFAVCSSLILIGCSSLLPDSHQESLTPWHSYADAQEMYAKIIPGKTTLAEVKALGIDPDRTPNIAMLSHADLLHRLIPVSPMDIRLLDPALQECISAKDACFGYEIELSHLDRQRSGGFWMDFLNFDRTVDVTGWEFDAIIAIKNDIVVYKLWSGKPSIKRVEHEHSPLGPLQGKGASLIH